MTTSVKTISFARGAPSLDLIPVEVRDTFTESSFDAQVWSPRDSVTMLTLEDLA